MSILTCANPSIYDIQNTTGLICYMIMAFIYLLIGLSFSYALFITFKALKIKNAKTLFCFYIVALISILIRFLFLLGGIICYPASFYYYLDFSQAYFRDTSYILFFLKFVQHGLKSSYHSSMFRKLWYYGWIFLFAFLISQHITYVFSVIKTSDPKGLLMGILLIGQFLIIIYSYFSGILTLKLMYYKESTGNKYLNIGFYTFVFIYLFVALAVRVCWNSINYFVIKGSTIAWSYMIFVILPDAVPYILILIILARVRSPATNKTINSSQIRRESDNLSSSGSLLIPNNNN